MKTTENGFPIQRARSFTLDGSNQGTIASNLGIEIGGGVCTALVIAWLTYNKIGEGDEYATWLRESGSKSWIEKKWKGFCSYFKYDVDIDCMRLINDLFQSYSNSTYIGNHQIKQFESDILKDFGLTYDSNWVITNRQAFDIETIDTIANHMSESTNTYFMIRVRKNTAKTWGHRIGLIKNGNVYKLYDPNLGIYTANSLQGFKDSLSDMFNKINMYTTSDFWSVIPFQG